MVLGRDSLANFQVGHLYDFTIVIPRSASEEESLRPLTRPLPVILTEVRRQPNEAEGRSTVAAGKNVSNFFLSAVSLTSLA